MRTDPLFPPVSPDQWATTARKLTVLLPLWDAWCPDDGRLAAGLALIPQALSAPLPGRTHLIGQARTLIEASYSMVDYAVDHTDKDNTWRAWKLARAATVLIRTLAEARSRQSVLLWEHVERTAAVLARDLH